LPAFLLGSKKHQHRLERAGASLFSLLTPNCYRNPGVDALNPDPARGVIMAHGARRMRVLVRHGRPADWTPWQ
jgi:hypothetical protein